MKTCTAEPQFLALRHYHQRMIRVMCVDDHPLMREGIAAVIRSQPDMSLVVVKVHIKPVMEKLGAKDRTDAVAIGVRRGIIRL